MRGDVAIVQETPSVAACLLRESACSGPAPGSDTHALRHYTRSLVSLIPANSAIQDSPRVDVKSTVHEARGFMDCKMLLLGYFPAMMSRATSTIMSSWPPTILRRPSSTRIERVSMPCSPAAFSACRKKLEYTPA
jgi:hypothetical protein